MTERKTDTKSTAKKTDETEAPKATDTKYLVAVDTNARHVEIYLDGHKPSEGHRTVGEFEANVIEGTVKGEDDFDAKGDNILVAKAKSVLEELGIEDFKGYVFEDKASNAPTGDSYTLTHTDREHAVRDGENPAEKQAEISDNIDKAEAKYATDDRKKNDARPRGE